jgi:hypothetical protein
MSLLCDAKEEIERLNAINAELMESEDRQISLIEPVWRLEPDQG